MNPHKNHGDVTLSLTEETPGGGRVFQSWTICACGLDGLRARLGPPQHETVSTPEAVAALGKAALNQPGSVHFG